MPTYHFCFCREQRVDISVEAENEDTATEEASALSNKLDLDSADDESDDPGELELRDVED